MIDYGDGKLVRDFVPHEATAKGKIVGFKQVKGHELELWLKHELVQKAYRVASADSDTELREEMVDLVCVLGALIDERRLSAEELSEEMYKKSRERGGYPGGIVLQYIMNGDGTI